MLIKNNNKMKGTIKQNINKSINLIKIILNLYKKYQWSIS